MNALMRRNCPPVSTPFSVKVAPPPPPIDPKAGCKIAWNFAMAGAMGGGGGLVDLGEGQAEDEVRDLVGRLVLEPAGLLVEVVLAGVLLARVPERLAVVVVELGRVDGDDLEPVLALLEALHDRLGQQVLPLLPVARLERPGLLVGGSGERARDENGGAETHAEIHRGLLGWRRSPFRSFISGLSR